MEKSMQRKGPPRTLRLRHLAREDLQDRLRVAREEAPEVRQDLAHLGNVDLGLPGLDLTEQTRKGREVDRLGRLLALGIGFAFAFQTLVNLGVVVGLLPVTGLTLPFLSNGGSSLIVTLAMVGVLLSISSRRS
jgi:hypothetical protein